MEYRPLGPLRVSPIGVGGIHFGVYQDEAQSARIILTALDLGVNLIDTAPTYGQGRSEEIIGKALGKRRHEAVIATKVGIEPVPSPDGVFRAFPVPMTRGYIRGKLEASLRALGTDYLDLYQLHAPHLATLGEALTTMEELVQEGKVRAFGCANFNADEVEEAYLLAPGFASVQMHYSIMDRRAERRLIPTCRSHGIGVLCNRVLARGILSGEYRPGTPFPPGSRAALSSRLGQELTRLPVRLRIANALHDFAESRTGHSGIELALAWWSYQPGLSSAILGMANEAQVKANVEIVEHPFWGDALDGGNEVIRRLGMTRRVSQWPARFFER